MGTKLRLWYRHINRLRMVNDYLLHELVDEFVHELVTTMSHWVW